MNRKISLVLIALMIIALAYYLPGCDDLITEQITIIEAGHPIAEFEADKDAGCIPCTVQFSNTSQGPHQIWIWNFGDGKDSVDDSTENPIHIYDDDRSYQVSLTILDTTVSDTGRDTELKKRFLIIGTATGKIEASDSVGCPGLEVTFTPLDTGGVASYHWLFGDGQSSTDISPTHTYNDTGIFSVTLELTGVECPNKTLVEDSLIRIHYCPDVAIWKDTNNICGNTGITFADSTQVDSPTVILSRAWVFGSDTTDDGNNPYITFQSSGDIEVSLTNKFEIISSGVTDTILLTAYDTVTVYNTTGDINFIATPLRGCLSDFQQFVVHFTNLTPGDIDSVEWQFGDGYISHDLEPYHAYITPDHYSCILSVWGPCGYGIGVMNDLIWVDDSIPTGLTTEEYFTITPLTADSADTFFLEGQLNDTLLSYTWVIEWVDGTDSIIATAPGEFGIDTLSFVFDGSGTFDISLQISNECNVFTVKDSVVVTSTPEPPVK